MFCSEIENKNDEKKLVNEFPKTEKGRVMTKMKRRTNRRNRRGKSEISPGLVAGKIAREKKAAETRKGETEKEIAFKTVTVVSSTPGVRKEKEKKETLRVERGKPTTRRSPKNIGP